MKTCSKCGILKDDSLFHKDKSQRSGLRCWCKDCVRIYIKNWAMSPKWVSYRKIRGRNKESQHSDWIKKTYGMSKIEYNNILHQQGGRCAICGIKQSTIKKRFCVDHNHKTGKIRGLLCQHCNSMIGFSKDSTENLQKGIDYLLDKNAV